MKARLSSSSAIKSPYLSFASDFCDLHKVACRVDAVQRKSLSTKPSVITYDYVNIRYKALQNEWGLFDEDFAMHRHMAGLSKQLRSADASELNSRIVSGAKLTKKRFLHLLDEAEKVLADEEKCVMRLYKVVSENPSGGYKQIRDVIQANSAEYMKGYPDCADMFICRYLLFRDCAHAKMRYVFNNIPAEGELEAVEGVEFDLTQLKGLEYPAFSALVNNNELYLVYISEEENKGYALWCHSFDYAVYFIFDLLPSVEETLKTVRLYTDWNISLYNTFNPFYICAGAVFDFDTGKERKYGVKYDYCSDTMASYNSSMIIGMSSDESDGDLAFIRGNIQLYDDEDTKCLSEMSRGIVEAKFHRLFGILKRVVEDKSGKKYVLSSKDSSKTEVSDFSGVSSESKQVEFA